MDAELRNAIRKVVAEEIEAALPVELWLVNENDADVVVPTERFGRAIAQSVVNRLEVVTKIETKVHLRDRLRSDPSDVLSIRWGSRRPSSPRSKS